MKLRYPSPTRSSISVGGWFLSYPTEDGRAMHSELSPAWIDTMKYMKGWYLGGVKIWEEKV